MPHSTGARVLSSTVQPPPAIRFVFSSAGRLALAAGLTLLVGGVAASAANVTLTALDAPGTSSFNAAGHWSNGAAPTAGNAYFTAGFNLRVPADTVAYTFAGDSLSVDAGARLLGKTTGTTQVVTVNNLILNGGSFEQATANSDNNYLTWAGNINVAAASGIAALGGTANGSTAFETLDITAVISGSAALTLSGDTLNGGQDSGVVRLSAANAYSGTITVSNRVIASTVNRLLQLNHLAAAGNATLNLTSLQPNPVSFTAEANTGAFQVGALTGTANQTLTDTGGSPITLSLGGNNASTTYAGALMGVGALVKQGSGTLTLAGTNSFTGNTTVNAGRLALAVSGTLSNSPVIAIASGASLDVSANNFTLVANQSLLGGGTIQGSVNAASGAKIYAGTDGTFGTNTFAGNLTLAAGATVGLDLGTKYNGSNDLITVGGNLALNSTTFHLKAFDGSYNLDTTADYTLVMVTGSISGNVAATPTWDVPPINAANYSIVQSGNAIKLHYTVSTPPAGYGQVSPDTVTRNQKALVSVTVTSSSHPISSVTLDASSLGGSSVMPLLAAGGGVYTNTVAAGAGIVPGAKTLVATITDNTSLAGTTPVFTLNVTTASVVWSGGGANDNWSSSPNWAGGAAPGYVGDTITFAGSTRLTPNLETSYNVTDVTFDGSAGSFVIGATGGALTLTGSGVVNNSGNGQTLNVPVTVAGAAVTFNAAAGSLTLAQGITNGGNAITVAGENVTTVKGEISGAGGLGKNDGGTLVLSGTNTFAGGMYIVGGTVQIAGAGLLGNGNYAGTITNVGVFQYSSSATQILSGVITFYGVTKDGSGPLILTAANTYIGDTVIGNGVLQIAGAGSLGGGNYGGTITDNGTFQYSSSAAQILTGSLVGSGGVVKDGPGTLTLNGPTAYAGATVVAGGTLVLNPTTVGYGTFNALTISNAALTVNAGTGSTLPVGSLTLNHNAILNLNYDFGSGNPAAAALGVTTGLVAPGTQITINVGGVGAAVGQFPLITYAGSPLAGVGNFVLGALPPGVTAQLVNNTANQSIDLSVTAVVTATWIPLTATDAFGTSSFNSAGVWADGNAPSAANGYYTKTFAVRSPADVNPYTFAGAALSVDAGGRFLMKGLNGQVVTVNNLILNGGVADYANVDSDNFTETLAGGITLQSGLTSYLGALGSTGFETLFVTAPISGGGNLQVGGDNVNAGQARGTVVLAGTNTYTGTTAVRSGVLLVNGVLGNSPVTVGTNTTLGGTGVVGGPINVLSGGRLAPGMLTRGALTATLGTLTAGNVTVEGMVLMKIDRAAMTNSDRLAAPAVVVNAGATLTVNNLGSTNLVAGDTFKLFSVPVSGSFATMTLPTLPGTNVFWTNNLAVNGTIAVVAAGPVINPGSTNITFSISDGSLLLSWPKDHTGWLLQVQTNSLGAGLGTNWVDVPGSTATNAVVIPVNPANGAVFYRLKL